MKFRIDFKLLKRIHQLWLHVYVQRARVHATNVHPQKAGEFLQRSHIVFPLDVVVSLLNHTGATTRGVDIVDLTAQEYDA
jgi:hypothetical protein